ncbi:MAG: TdeIII family type II restriction endonuclease [Methanocellales archaeon]|nr:TdeIII family type II restriction endonuclease [Methanocellales archaeon]
MKNSTRREVKEVIMNFAQKRRKVPYTIEELKRAFPFHTIFFPDEALISFKQQRGLVTSMGMTLYPKVATIIAKDRYDRVHRDHEIIRELDVAKVSVIDKIVNDLREGRRRPDFDREMQEILTTRNRGKTQTVRVIADLFVGDFKPGPLFLEIKSPRPNLDVCAESKKKMLFFRALLADKNPEAFFAFPYNPFIYREEYRHNFTKQIMDMDKEVLIGEEMWNKLGGKDTYGELLSIIEEVRRGLKHP